MDVTVRSGGRHRLSSLTPMEYCWVASHFASGLRRDPNFAPTGSELTSMLFSCYLDRFHYKIDYSALILSVLIFHGNHLLVCYPRTEVNGHVITWFSHNGATSTTRREMQPRCCVPTFVTSRSHGSYGFNVDNPGRQVPSPIELVLYEWAERITGSIDRIDSLDPGVLYKTIPDDGTEYPRAADEHVLGIVAGVFKCDHGQEEKTDSNTDHDGLNFDAIRYNYRMDSMMTAEWMTELQIHAVRWHSRTMKDLALAAFKAKRGTDMTESGYETGQLS
ncbi:hypothetical protein K461DRAFT_150315 [Myriangium duriaei CBS 260.36]|uniref:Uncharacterized protein n=1 Tax=Myriangium duriaei CBS 260.36 TaxID=1168546 RepID=A0A9P4J569_9PEZI|nr:hypothetical protein K461DRAFT_150315 [Myriangium duriaei CBS 260.36]